MDCTLFSQQLVENFNTLDLILSKKKMKIDYKKLVESLSDEKITKKDYDNAQQLISERVQCIWLEINKALNKKVIWWAFRNDEGGDDGNGSSGGYFDPKKDMEFIRIDGEVSRFDDNYFSEGFPTEYLWDENYIEKAKEYLEQKQKEKQEKKQKFKAKLEKTKNLKSSINQKIALYAFSEDEVKLIRSALTKVK